MRHQNEDAPPSQSDASNNSKFLTSSSSNIISETMANSFSGSSNSSSSDTTRIISSGKTININKQTGQDSQRVQVDDLMSNKIDRVKQQQADEINHQEQKTELIDSFIDTPEPNEEEPIEEEEEEEEIVATTTTTTITMTTATLTRFPSPQISAECILHDSDDDDDDNNIDSISNNNNNNNDDDQKNNVQPITTQDGAEMSEDQPPNPYHHHLDLKHQFADNRHDHSINSRLTECQLEALSSLIMIIREGSYEEFLELLEGKGFKNNMLNVFVDGQTALHYTLIYGRSLAWCKQLVSNGANPNLTNRAGWHPIHLAAFNGSRETMRYLIDCIAN